jgi:hypothetical protein
MHTSVTNILVDMRRRRRFPIIGFQQQFDAAD